MITREIIDDVIEEYDHDNLAIGTLGSHSALNIFKGAKQEGFRTVCICKPSDMILYKRFPLADEIILVENFAEILQEPLQKRLRELNTILIPHGSFTAYLSTEQMTNDLKVPMLGNRQLLHWEANRLEQEEWLKKSGLRLPKTYGRPEDITGLTIAKLPGAKGGRGYFLANSPDSYNRKIKDMLRRKLLTEADVKQIHLQQYVLGVNVYSQYFSSTVKEEVELLGADKRYESAVDAIGRIPASEQLEMGVSPTYTIIGNIPITLRESILPELIRMGDNVNKTAKQLAPPGIIGPFCLETVITDTVEIYTFEISARIVAGTNVGIGTSPYAYLKYGENMYIGRRIALEIEQALERGMLHKIVA